MKRVYIIAIIVALIAGIVTYMFANEIQKSAETNEANKIDVVCAVSDITKDTVITKDMLAVNRMDKSVLSTGTSQNANELIGKIAVDNIYAGEIINSKNLVKPGDKDDISSNVSYQLAHNEYAFTIETSKQSSVGYAVKNGDYVNILYFYTSDKATKVQRLYDKIKVLRVGDESEIAGAKGSKLVTYSSVTVIVTREQSLKLSEAIKNGSLGLELFAFSDAVNK